MAAPEGSGEYNRDYALSLLTLLEKMGGKGNALDELSPTHASEYLNVLSSTSFRVALCIDSERAEDPQFNAELSDRVYAVKRRLYACINRNNRTSGGEPNGGHKMSPARTQPQPTLSFFTEGGGKWVNKGPRHQS